MEAVLLYCVNDPAFFISHRLEVAKAASKAGYVVHVATKSGLAVEAIKACGFTHHELPLSRSGSNIFSECKAFFSIWRLCWTLKPQLLHLVTIKPVLYGGISARLSPVKSVVVAISGLGFVFMAKGCKASVLRFFAKTMYRVALGKKDLRVVFQNTDDQSTLVNIGAVTHDKSVLIRGSGVNLSEYQYLSEQDSIPVVTFAARLLRDKGLMEFVQAARILKSRGLSVRFQLAGDLDPGNPTSIDPLLLQEWWQENTIEYLGHQSDIAQLFIDSHIVVLPSYREGLPKVLVEAAACGRAVVTTDVPGCRDAIIPNVTGLLVPVGDSNALAAGIERLVLDHVLRQSMGRAGRQFAEQNFSIKDIVSQHLELYKMLENSA